VATERSLSLDALRALAILLVLGHHFTPPGENVPVIGELSKAWQRGGWIGVDLFFVLSGFLISGLLFREYQRYGAIRYGHFIIRRGLKIYPAFYTLLLATVTVRLVREAQFLKPALYEATFLQNYGPRLWGHTWSLAVEEHFYVLLPPLLIWLARRSRGAPDPFRLIPRILFVLTVTVLMLRLATAHFLPYHDVTHFFPTHLRIDALMFGVFVSYLYHYQPKFRTFCSHHFAALTLGGVGLLLPLFWMGLGESAYIHTVGFTQLSVGGSLLLMGVVTRGLPEIPLTRAAAHIGSHSYSIYLWHLPVKLWGVEWLRGTGLPGSVAWLIYFIGSIGVGIVMGRLIELPVLKLRDRVFPSRSNR
jgi:peptidoglycan/LPS O-acetylase OafA/YrhL